MHRSLPRILSACSLLAVTGSVVAETVDLAITVTNIQKVQGSLLVAVIDKPDFWLDTKAKEPPFKNVVYPVNAEGEAVITISDMPAGNYAISIFQDLNANEKLDTNFIGYPKEPFGFSAPMGKFGPPDFDQASFTIKGEPKAIVIELN